MGVSSDISLFAIDFTQGGIAQLAHKAGGEAGLVCVRR